MKIVKIYYLLSSVITSSKPRVNGIGIRLMGLNQGKWSKDKDKWIQIRIRSDGPKLRGKWDKDKLVEIKDKHKDEDKVKWVQIKVKWDKDKFKLSKPRINGLKLGIDGIRANIKTIRTALIKRIIYSRYIIIRTICQGYLCRNEIVFKDRCVAQNCENLDKVQAKQEGGKKELSLKFDGKADFNENKDVAVQLVFPDNKDKPIVKQGGNANSYIKRQIYRYRSSFLSETLDDSPITSGNDDFNNQGFGNSPSQMKTLIANYSKMSKLTKFLYRLLFSQANNLREENRLILFTFFVAVYLNGNIITTQAQSEAQDDTPACVSEDNCVSRVETEVGFCSDQTCSTLIDQPQVYAGQNFYVVHRLVYEQSWKVGTIGKSCQE